jgi:hypothetical protein
VLIETFIRKQLRLKAQTMTKVEERQEKRIISIDGLHQRLLQRGFCRLLCKHVDDIRKERDWRDLSMRKLALKLRYPARRVDWPRCGVYMEHFPWA